jgi:hypothetical protein
MIVRWRDLIDVEVKWDRESRGYRAIADELPEGEGFGRTPDEALRDLEPALIGWCEVFEALAEAKSVAPVLKTVVRGYLEEIHAPTHDELLNEVFGQSAVGENPQQREMCFFIGHVNAFTPVLLERLRQQVLGRFPNWSLLAQFQGRQIGITPTAFVFDEQTVVGRLDEDHPAYIAWMQSARHERERCHGARWRQLRYVQGLLPERMKFLCDVPAVHLGTFDQWRPGFEGYPVWVLHCQRGRFKLGSDSAGERKSGVTPSGEILPEFGSRAVSDFDSGPWVVMYVLDEIPTEAVQLADEKGNLIASLEVRPVIRDDRLRESLGTLD